MADWFQFINGFSVLVTNLFICDLWEKKITQPVQTLEGHVFAIGMIITEQVQRLYGICYPCLSLTRLIHYIIIQWVIMLKETISGYFQEGNRQKSC